MGCLKINTFYLLSYSKKRGLNVVSNNTETYNRLLHLKDNDTSFISTMAVVNNSVIFKNYLLQRDHVAIAAKNNGILEIYNNSIKNYGIGITLYDSIPTNTAFNRVSNNTFIDCKYGVVYSPYEFPVNKPTGSNESDSIGSLELACNKFVRNDIGVVGSGKVINYSDTQNVNSVPRDNMNEFWNSKDWDAVWYEPDFKKIIWNLSKFVDDHVNIYPFLNEGNYINCYWTETPDIFHRRTTLDYNPISINGNTFAKTFSPSTTDTNFMMYRAGDDVDICRQLGNYDLIHQSSVNDKLNVENEIIVYPNPAHSKITIEFKSDAVVGAEIMLYDIRGSQLLTDKFNSSIFEIDVSTLPSGLYLLRVLTGDSIKVIKIVKE